MKNFTSRSYLMTFTFLMLSMLFSIDAKAQYCTPSGSAGNGAFIGEVCFPTTAGPFVNCNQTNTGSNYGDFTGLGSRGTFSPTPTGTGTNDVIVGIDRSNAGDYTYAIYIDFNQDDDFEDAAEQVYTGSGNISFPQGGRAGGGGVLTIPNTATNGNTRMRIIVQEGTTPVSGPCITGFNGEPEDYIITISGAGMTGGDTTPPMAACQNVIVQLDAAGNASVTAMQVDNGSTDDTGITMRSVSPNTFTCADIGANTVTLTVTDAAGNMATCTATVTVQDNIDPTITCTANATRNPGSGQMTYTVQGTEFDPTASGDNCGTSTLTHNFNGGGTSLAGEMLPVGDTTVTWTANDGNGQTATCMVTVTVEYDANPTIVGTANDDSVLVSIDGTEVVVTLNGTEVLRQPSADTVSITVDGGNGNDTFEADLTGGSFPFSITFNGEGQMGAPGDLLRILGTFTNQEVTHLPAGADGNNGELTLDTSMISYTGLEPIVLGGGANLTINLPNGSSNSATLQNSATGGQTEIIDNGATFENTVFPNPTNSLTINSGDSGDDISVRGVDAAFDASLTINANDAGDLVSFDTNPTDIGSGDLTVTAAINLGEDVTTTGNATLNGNTIVIANSVIAADASATFNGTVDGNSFLDVNSSGLTQFADVVGSTTPVRRLRTNAAGTTQFDASVTTGGQQRYNDPVTITTAATFTSTNNNIEFRDPVGATTDLTLIADNNVQFFQGGTIGSNLVTTSVTGTTDFRNQTLAVTGTATLNGVINTQANAVPIVDISGTSISINGTLAPGASPGLFVVSGAFDISGSMLDVEVEEFDTPGTEYDQVVVTGTVDITGATLNLIDNAPVMGVGGDMLTLIDNDMADAIVGTFAGLPEGSLLNFNGEFWQLSYVGGDGNDVVLSFGAPTEVTLVAGELRIVDNEEKDDDLTISYDGTNYTITDNNGGFIGTNIAGSTGSGTATVTIPNTGVTSVLATTLGGDDSFEVDLSNGNFVVPVNYDGGLQTAGDAMALSGGGTFDTVEHFFTNNNDGSIAVTGNSTISYTGLEPVIDNLDANNRIFTFTSALDETITLDAGGTLDNQIDSTQGESVDFNNPNTSLTINTEASGGAGIDVVNVEGVEGTFDADLTVNGGTGDTVNFQTNPTNIGGGDLMVAAEVLSVNETVSTTGNATTTSLKNTSIAAAGTLQTDGNIDITSGTAGVSGAGYIGLTVNGAIETANAGNITVDATGAAPGNFRPGILVGGTGSIQAMGTGAINLTGTGGMNGNNSHGIGSFPGATITSNGGGITMVGNTTGGTGNNKYGIAGNNVTIEDLNGGTITITGTSNGTGTSEKGIVFSGGASVNSDGADITLTGNGSLAGISTANSGIDLDASTVNATNGGVTVNGTPGAGGSFSAVNILNAGASVTAANTITVNATVGEINTPAGIATSTTFTASETIIDGILAPGQSPGQLVIAGDFTIGAGDTLEVEVVEFDTAGTDYDQVVVNGIVDITDAMLDLQDMTGATGEICDTLVIIDNDGADPVMGTFLGQVNGSDIVFNGETWRIFYDGGDGNDVIVTFIPAAPIADVYVNDDFTQPNGTCIPDADPNTAGAQAATVGVTAFPTIQQGVDAVGAGGNVNITDDLLTDGPGMYTENVVVANSMNILSTENDATAVIADGGVTGSVFTISAGAFTVTIDAITIQNGAAAVDGGGINNTDSDLTITDSVLQDNVATTGVASGGGIFSGGTLTVLDTTIDNNDANRAGGGIEIATGSGVTTLTNVDLTNNEALGGSGPGNGGALHITGAGNIIVNGGLVQNNSAVEGGGFWNGTGLMTINSVSFDDNIANGSTTGGGGIFTVGGPLDITDTNFNNNLAITGTASGGAIFAAANAVVDIDGSPTGGFFQGNQANRAGGAIEMSAGGFLTISNSDLGNNEALGLPGNGGAIHLTGNANLTITDSNVAANTAAQEGGGLWNGTGVMTIVNTTISSNNAEAGNNGGNDQGGGGIFNAGGTLDIDDSIITNNLATTNLGNGGGVMTDGGIVTIDGGNISTNEAARAGGGIENFNGTVIIGATTAVNVGGATPAEGNTAGINGGGLHVSGTGTTNVTGGSFQNNIAQQEGGGLWNGGAGAVMTIDGTSITENSANGALSDQGGGGVFNNGGTLDVLDGTLINNNTALGALGSGGGVMSISGAVTISGTTTQVNNNVANRAGGGIEIIAGTLTTNDITLNLNNAGVVGPGGATAAAPGNGGGLHVSGVATIQINGGNVEDNIAASEGGGLWNQLGATMVLDNPNINRNTASGASATEGGGGVFNNGGDLTIINSTLDNNVADGLNGSGGGIFNELGGVLTLTDVTVQNNTANRAGGGIELNTNPIDTFTFDNLTLNNNTATGTGVAPGNGGGLHVSGAGTVTLTNSNVTNNTAVEGGGLWNGAGMMTVDATNVDDNEANGNTGGGGIFNVSGTLNVSNGSTVNDNDANGATGSGGGIMTTGGAVTLSDSSIFDNTSNRAGGGLEYAGGTMSITATDFRRNETGVVTGPGAPGNGGGIHVTGNFDLTLDGLAVRNNTAANEGGGLWNGAGTMTITDVRILDNVANGDDAGNSGGGGIYNEGGIVTTDADTVIRDNTATVGTGSGGGVLNANGTFIATGTFFRMNLANRAGGAIEVNGAAATTTIIGSTFNRNRANGAPGNGGGIHITGPSDSSIDTSTFFANFANNEGGGLWNGSGTMTITGTTIDSNEADAAVTANSGGGGIFNQGGTINLDATTSITNNEASTGSGSGGGVLNAGGTFTATGTTITGNDANRAGGGIEVNGAATTNLTDVTLDDNEALGAPGNGGGLHITGSSDSSITGGTVDNNIAANEGGGLWNGTGIMTLSGVSITNNVANSGTTGGGGVFNNGGTIDVDVATDVTNNVADGVTPGGRGGGYFNNTGGTLNIASGSTITMNYASRAGGGIEDASGNTLILDNVTISENGAGVNPGFFGGVVTPNPGNGGGVHLSGTTDATITGSLFEENLAASQGGGLWNATGSNTDIVASIFEDNIASGDTAAEGGGGIYNDGGLLSIESGSIIRRNIADGTSGSGGGIFNDGGNVTIDASEVRLNRANRAGGGIENVAGNLTLTATILNQNNAGITPAVANPGNGGGLHVGGASTVNISGGSVVANNVAASEGGGLWNSATGTLNVAAQLVSNIASGATGSEGGGAIYNDGGTLSVSNSLIQTNVADGAAGSGGGILSVDGDVSITATNLNTNEANRAGGAIELVEGSLTMSGSQMTSNVAGAVTGPGAPGNGGGLHITGAANSNITGGIVTTNSAASEGGGLWNGTGTMIVDGTTITLNVASGDDPTNGGGGIFNNGGTLDVLAGTTIDNNTADGVAGSGGGIFSTDGTVTITGSSVSTNTANRAGGGVEVIDGTFTLTTTNLDNNIATGAGAVPGNGGGLHVSGDADINVTNGTVDSNLAASEGGGLWNGDGLMSVDGTTITNNIASGDDPTNGGGGIFNNGGDLTISTGTLIDNNIADGTSGSGGGIFSVDGALDLTGVIITNNRANRAGGGVEVQEGSVALTDTTLDDNNAGVAPAVAAPGNGGGLHVSDDATVSVTGGSVNNNVAALEGGGLWNGSGTMTTDGATIDGNIASGAGATEGGGGIFNAGGTLNVTNGTTITNNVANGASGSGGGILNDLGDLSVSDSEISGNTSMRAGGGIEDNSVSGNTTNLTNVDLLNNVTAAAPGNGGGMHITGPGDSVITGGNVSGNTAALEGGGLWNGSGAMSVTSTTIDGNTASGPGATEGGGGIFNNGGDLSVTNVTISNNIADGTSGSGGGILNDQGTLAVSDSELSGNTSMRAGGAIEDNAASSTTIITDTDILNNSTAAAPGNGGGVHISGGSDMNITGGNVSGNTAALEGGGLWNGSGAMSVTGTTIDGNTASGAGAAEGGGGIFNNGGDLSVANATITNNIADGAAGSGGGILNDQGTLSVSGTSLSGNSASRAGGGIEDNSVSGNTLTLTNVDLDGNIASAAPGNGGGLHITGPGDSVITGGNVTNNVAAAEGGGLWNGTGNMSVTGTSIMDNTASGADATQGGGGLFNAGGILTITGADISDNVADGAAGSGGGIFNDGGTLTVTDSDIDENTSVRAGGGIEQNSGTTAGVMILDNVSFDTNMTGGAPGNGGAVHITGAGDSMITGGEAVDNRADSEGGAFWNGTGMMTIDGTFIEGNRASGDATNEGGGGVFNAGGTLSISNATIMNNDANGNSGSGGGILNDGGTLNVENTTISDNDASRAGGGIEDNSVSGGMLTLTDVILSNNEVGNSPGNGGGLHITGSGDSTITGGEVTGNLANSEGGGLWNDKGTMSVSGTLIDNNTAGGGSASNGGGGIFNNGGTLDISDLSITNNMADGTSGSGGGVFSTAGAVTMDNVIIDGNAANRAGGGIEMIDGTMDISSSELTGNDVNGGAGVANPGNGGAFHVTGMGATINIEATKVSGNAAANEGGGLWNQNGTTMNILTTTVDNNTASDGGGVYNNTAGIFIGVRSTISSNTASASGGGITNDGASLDLNAVTVANNTAASGGGIQSNTSTSLKNTLVANNTAGSGTDVSGSFSSNDYNLIGTDDTNAFPEAANDIEETDPMLGPLQDNGGPTETHELMDGSLAYDAGDPSDNFADQRGEAVFASARDIGAFEAQEELLGVDDFTTDTEGIIIYPNPTKGVSIAAIPQSFGAEVRVTIVELSGKIVRDYTITAGENDIDFRGMANGVYVVQFVSENRTSTHRVILDQ